MIKNFSSTWMFVLVLGLIMTSGCKQEAFRSELNSEAKPWTHSRFDSHEDKFTFAVFADLTGREREGVFEVAMEQLNLLRPEFIVNVGDLIEGNSDDPAEWNRQWDGFDKRASRARAPVFYAGGNHDLTGELSRKIWKERLGPDYYHFLYKDVLFLILNTEDHTPERMTEIQEIRGEAIEILNAEGMAAYRQTAYASLPERGAGNISQEQSDYFTEVIASHPDVRWTFVLIHKPAWERADEQNFAAIERAMENQPYTVFYGHTHTYKYEQRHGRDYINLGTTGGGFPGSGPAADRLMMVTVDDQGINLANLRMDGILDKTGHIPLGGDSLVFENQQ